MPFKIALFSATHNLQSLLLLKYHLYLSMIFHFTLYSIEFSVKVQACLAWVVVLRHCGVLNDDLWLLKRLLKEPPVSTTYKHTLGCLLNNYLRIALTNCVIPT